MPKQGSQTELKRVNELKSHLRIRSTTRKGDETSPDSRENVGTQSSQLHLEWPSQRPLFYLVEERELEAG